MEDILSKTLITGTNGMVGTYIDFGIKTSRKQLNIIDFHSVIHAVKKYKPKVIIHLAAETNVDKSEKFPEQAYLTNTVGTQNVLVAAHLIGAKVVYISTAGVFDGLKDEPYDESDIPNPQNHYSKSKYLGEKLVQDMFRDYLIIRPGWMFGGGPEKDHKFVGKVVELLDKGEIKAVVDKKGSPTYAKDLVEKIKELIVKNKSGIYHLANSGISSRYEMAQVIAKTLKPETKVHKVDSSYFTQGVARINSEAIISNKLKMRPWKKALREYLLTEWGRDEK
jgi:dTDP-4-dehydrorhamnose reductase